jgi:hypothetical protein
MFEYHQTNGNRGEIAIEYHGNFVGFIVNLGQSHQWAAYTRQLELIGDRYGSRGDAALACYHRCSGEPPIPMRDVAKVEQCLKEKPRR